MPASSARKRRSSRSPSRAQRHPSSRSLPIICSAIQTINIPLRVTPSAFTGLRAWPPSASRPRRSALNLRATAAAAGVISPSSPAALRITAAVLRAPSGITVSRSSPPAVMTSCQSPCPRSSPSPMRSCAAAGRSTMSSAICAPALPGSPPPSATCLKTISSNGSSRAARGTEAPTGVSTRTATAASIPMRRKKRSAA